MVQKEVSKENIEPENQVDNDESQRKMFLGGLSPNSTEDSLRVFYQQFGDIVDVIVMRDQTSGRSKGFGFITFKDPGSVDRAQAVRPHVIDGKPIDSKRVLPRAETSGQKNVGNNSGRKVFVGGLKSVHDEQCIMEHFQQFGNILGIKILVDKTTGRKRGFGYIEFEDYDSADKAALHNNHMIKYLTVDVKKSTYKPETNRKFENQEGESNKRGTHQNATAPPAQGAYPPGPYPPPYGYPGYNGWGAPPSPYPQQGAPPAPYPQQGATPAPYPQQGAQPAPYPQQQPPTYGGAPPAWNGWGYSAPLSAEQPPAANGNYQQVYNGGPQKSGKLQGYRNKPYQV